MPDFKELLVQHSHSAGFQLIGFTAPEVPAPAVEHFQRWLRRGYHAGMHYLSHQPETRSQPHTLFPFLHSVISLAINYYKEPQPPPSYPAGSLALYAWGKDYHLVIRQKLKEVMNAIQEHLKAEFYYTVTVDTAPLLERAFAWHAGLGFIGKNTFLISPQLGSWFFLAEILTDLPLEADTPAAHNCHECSLCLEACPTGALRAPYILDANLCLAYHTVENRGEIPQELRPLVGDHLLGCDICQRACPFNQNRPPTTEIDFTGHLTSTGYLSLKSIFELSGEAEFRQRFQDTAFIRPGYWATIRNASLVAANLGEKSFAEAIHRLSRNSQARHLQQTLDWCLDRLSA